MAEVLLGAFLQVLFDRLASRELLNFARRKKLRSRLKGWERNLQDINIVLEDAEYRAMVGESRVINPWLDDLKDLAYDVDDLLDEFATEEALHSSSFLLSDMTGASSSKLRNLLLPGCITHSLSPRRLLFNDKMRSKVEEIDGRLSEIISHKETLGLREGGGRRTYVTVHDRRFDSTSLVELFTVGRDDDREAILNLVMDESEDLSVIPIVGMGGLGKTTLAQLVYNDEKVTGSFHVRAWACVSDEFDMLAVTKTILQSVGGASAHEGKDLNALQVELQRHLSGKKFLIVLDDVWNENYERWTLLRRPFESGGAKGSKIIVTTRNLSVASKMKSRTGPAYTLGMLSPDDCEALLAYHALGAFNFDNHPDLKPAGEKIAAKCAGLPLAAKTVGGVLRSKYELKDWTAIAESKIWDLPEETNGVPQALKLSYFYLPSIYKRCFAYCAVFPKDYEFDKHDLISLWMAEGLLTPQKKSAGHQEGSMRDLGLKYFDELLSRSLFQPSSRSNSLFVMHDLLNDLAASIAGESCLSLGEGQLHREKKSLEKVRHLSLIPHYYEVEGRFDGFHCLRGLRTFLALDNVPLASHIADNVIDDVLQNQKILRVLSLSGYRIKEVPNCIGSLRHLRYLNLSGSPMQYLPPSMSTLCNLEALILQFCQYLVELPSWINKLINLRCVDIRGTPSLKKMPRGIGSLVKLEILPKFIVGGDDGPKLKELKDLQLLREELTIEGLCNVGEVGDAREAALNAKTGLTSLILWWGQDEGPASGRDAESQMQILDCLQPHASIKNLEIDGYGGTKLPSWIGGPSFVQLERLRLCNCGKTKMLPSLGVLPQLKELEVERMDAICAVGPEFYGNTAKPFPSLETLLFINMSAWEQWSLSTGNEQENNLFPRLCKLTLRTIPKLIIGGWPSQFPALVELVIDECPRLETPVATVNLPSLKEGNFSCCDGRMLRGVISISSSVTRLTMFNITRISELTSFLQGGSLSSSLKSLEELSIERCDELMCLWEEKDGVTAGIDPNHVLKRLTVNYCRQLVRIGTFPCNHLEYLRLDECDNLEELPQGIMTCGLVELHIVSCPSLTSLSRAKLPGTLRKLEVSNCKNLQSLPEGIVTAPKSSNCCDDDSSSRRSSSSSSNGIGGRGNGATATMWSQLPPQLQEVRIISCPSLVPFPFSDENVKQLVPSLKKIYIAYSEVLGSSLEGTTAVGLEEIHIESCKMLKSLTPHLHRSFTRLTLLIVEDCPALELECFPQLPDSLRELNIENCPGIKSLPLQMHAHQSLRKLQIYSCTGIASFPEEGLPPNLEDLIVSNCENLNQPMSKWGLKRTAALRRLTIFGKIGCLVGTNSFPPPPNHEEEEEEEEEEQGQGKGGWHVLPPSLTDLSFSKQENLVTLSRGMQSHLTSLQILSIWWSPKLKFLPREGLPASLCLLYIRGCTEDLVKRCSKEGGGGGGGSRDYYFPLIERIPLVEIS
ncbi:putative disease resistance RPP13-like protein 1 [Punica granatum]|uniref:Disease resistance RPP13-like protein 1 n=1 Tax=Punica granatum TaxID=22663 RepID=A0A6P8DXF0_PUNGR|nr:putative disease resistance RPP13-like protein 1 [Punica granatum]